MNRTCASRSIAALLLGLALGPAPLRADTALPAVKVEGSVQYLSGGIGADETAAIKAESARYALTVLFAETRSGRDVFLATVSVSIRDRSGQLVLETVTEGPYLLVNLPAGRYALSAAHAGIERRLSLDIRAGTPQRHSLVWPYTEQQKDPEPSAAPAVAPDLSDALPPLRTEGGIPFRSGGVGAQESQALRRQFRHTALALTFASSIGGRNAYLASVPVRILDAAGTPVFELSTDGPFLLIDLPPGRYEVIATHDGREQRAKVQVSAGKPLERAFVWTSP